MLLFFTFMYFALGFKYYIMTPVTFSVFYFSHMSALYPHSGMNFFENVEFNHIRLINDILV